MQLLSYPPISIYVSGAIVLMRKIHLSAISFHISQYSLLVTSFKSSNATQS